MNRCVVYIWTFVLALLCFQGKAQYSKVHYLPPTYNQKSGILFSTITVTTLEETPFNVTVSNASGTYNKTLTGLSKINPITVTVPKGDADGIFLGSENKTNKVLTSEGFTLTAEEYFFTNQIHSVHYQAAVIAAKGSAGLGTEFYSGHIYSEGGNKSVRAHFISVMATEDNTVVHFDNQKIKWQGQENAFNITLNKGESYVVAAPFDYIHGLSVSDKYNAHNGTHVTSDKPIVMNSGSFLGSHDGGGAQDAGVDQIVPVDILNDEFVIVQGQSNNPDIENVMVIATEDNTKIYVNGSTTASHTLNKGEFTIVDGSNYINKTMHIKTSSPSLVYQNLAGSESYATVGMVFVPGLMENASRSVMISDANSIGSVSLYIVAKKGEEVKINGVDIKSTPIDNAGNQNWVTYRVSPTDLNNFYCINGSTCGNTGVNSDFIIESTGPINAAVSLVSGAVGAAGYFSGFASVEVDVGVSEFGTLDFTIPCTRDTVSLLAKGAVSYEWDSPSGDDNLISKVNDSTYLFNYDQSGAEGPFKYRVMTETRSILGALQFDTTVVTIHVDFDPSCACTTPVAPTVNGTAGDTVTSFYFDISNPVNEVITSFSKGERYRTHVSETWSVWSSDPTKRVADGAYRYREKNASADITPIEQTVWSLNGSTAHRPFPNEYNPEHNYWYYLEAKGNNETITFSDNNYADNGGGLNFYFFRLPDTIKACQNNSTTLLSDFVEGQDIKWYTSFQSTTPLSTAPSVDNNTVALTEYWVSQTINECESEKVPILYLVKSLPIVDLGTDQKICAGDSITLNANNAGHTFSWNTGATSQKITVNQTGIYGVAVRDSIGCLGSDSMNLQVNELPVVDLGEDQRICIGAQTQLDASNTGLTYQWNTNASSPTITIKDAGIYGVEVRDEIGCLGSDSMTLHVNNLPVVDLGTDQRICAGESIALNANNAGHSFSWSTGATSQKITVDQTGIYGVEVRDSIGCLGSDSMTLHVNNLPVVDLGTDQKICAGDSITLNANNTGHTFSWNTGATSQKITVNQTGIYGVEVRDSIGCLGSDSMNLQVNELPVVDLGEDQRICIGSQTQLDVSSTGLTYQWNTNASSPTITIKDAGIYGVEARDEIGCLGSDSMTLHVNNLPVVDLGTDQKICAGESIALNANNAGHSFSWSTGATSQKITVDQTGIYGVEVRDSIGCLGSDSMNLQVNELPIVNLGPDTVICEWGAFTFDAALALDAAFDAGININNLNYSWNNGSTESTINVRDKGTYGVEVRDEIGCFGSDSVLLSIDVISDPFRDPSKDFCTGDTVDIFPDQYELTDRFYWQKGRTLVETDTLKVSSGGSYQAVVQSYHCQDTFTYYLTELDTPDVEIQDLKGQEHYCFDYESATLTLSGNDAPYTSVFWPLNDQWASVIEAKYAGKHIAIADDGFCSSTVSIQLETYCEPLLFIPNAFTPDGDGVNDLWKPINTYLEGYDLRIYNRWGNLVFKSNEPSKYWNGRAHNNGEELNSDVYVYKLEYEYYSEHEGFLTKQQVGTVTLVK